MGSHAIVSSGSTWQHYHWQVAGYWQRHRIWQLVSRNFVWDKWQEDVAKYVGGCIKCQKGKANRHSRQTKLVPIPTREQSFKDIAIDFFAELPQSEAFIAMLIVTDRFTTVQHYIPAKITWTAANIADIHIIKIWRLYGLPKHITSDHGAQFASKFVKELNKKLGIILCLSTAYHP